MAIDPPPTLVSFVIATWSADATLQRALDSITTQSGPVAEIIVIDGGSTDGTRGILERNDGRIHYWESRPDRGVYHAWNKALDHITSEWVCFLGADDRLAAPDVLSRMSGPLVEASGASRVVYATVNVIDDTGSVIAVVGAPWPESRAGLRERMTLPNPATFYHRSLFDEHGRFDERFRITGDYEFLLRELLDRDAVFVPELVAVLMDDGGLSSDPRLRTVRLREIATARHRHGLTRVPAWASPMVVKATIRSALERILGVDGTDRIRARYRALRKRPSDD